MRLTADRFALQALLIGIGCAVCISCTTPARPVTSSPISQLAHKLESIQIRPPVFTETTLADIVRWIELASRQADPSHEGIRIQFDASLAPQREQSDDTLRRSKPLTPSTNHKHNNLREVPLGEYLRYITDIAGLKFRLTEQAVIIFNPTKSAAPQPGVQP